MTTFNGYIIVVIVIIITIILIKSSNNYVLFKKKKKKDFLPTVPKSLWSRLGLNLGSSSFLPIHLST